MTEEERPEPELYKPVTDPHPVPPKKPGRRAVLSTVTAVALVCVGAVAGAGAMRLAGGRGVQTLIPPTSISALKDDSIAAVKGKVAEIFGNKFVVEDPTGRALVETGPRGEVRNLVARNETVTVQGRYDDGFMHGSMIVHADGRTNALGPLGGPPPPPHGPGAWPPRP